MKFAAIPGLTETKKLLIDAVRENKLLCSSMKLFFLSFLLFVSYEMKAQEELTKENFAREATKLTEELKDIKAVYEGISSDSSIWRIKLSNDNKFKIERGSLEDPKFMYQNNPVLPAYVGTWVETEQQVIMTFTFPNTDKDRLVELFKENKNKVMVLNNKAISIKRNLTEIWIYQTRCVLKPIHE